MDPFQISNHFNKFFLITQKIEDKIAKNIFRVSNWPSTIKLFFALTLPDEIL